MGAGDFFEGYLSSALGEDELLDRSALPRMAPARDGRCWR